jgi:hypothetical protein
VVKLLRLAHLRRDEALVVAEVEVGLRAVLGHEHLAVLERRHRARIDVDVRIELDEGDLDLARFEDRGEGGGGDALAQGRNHATGHEDVLGHDGPVLEIPILPDQLVYTVEYTDTGTPAMQAKKRRSPMAAPPRARLPVDSGNQGG